MKYDYEPISLMLVLEFESVMLRSTSVLLPAILLRLRRNCFLTEMKLCIIQRLQYYMHFRHADDFVELLEEEKRKAFHLDGFVLGNTNPLMVMVILTEILNHIKTRFRSLGLRIDFIVEELHSNLI